MSSVPPDNSNPNQIFIGREKQTEDFQALLERWEKQLREYTGKHPGETSPGKIRGLFILLYGQSGFGKTDLLEEYHKMALDYRQGLLVSNVIEWRNKGQNFPLFLARNDVDASQYFGILCAQLASALGKNPNFFRKYQAAVRKVESAKKRAERKTQNLIRRDGDYKALGEKGAMGVLILLKLTTKLQTALTDDQLKVIENLTARGIQITIEQLQGMKEKLRTQLGSQKGVDFFEPEKSLGEGLGLDLQRLAKKHPLLIFFDSYEEIDEEDELLRLVMRAAGVRVGWVLAGRDNLWEGPTQRLRYDSKIVSGYKEEIIFPGLSLAINFDTLRFEQHDIEKYFCKISHQELPKEETKHILALTLGIPLAVRETVDSIVKNSHSKSISKILENQEEMVDQLVNHFLAPAHNLEERTKLYGLALIRQTAGRRITSQSTLITAALDISRKASFQPALCNLHRRFSCIFTDDMNQLPSLHHVVRHFLRQHLLEQRNMAPEIVTVIQRLSKASLTDLQKLETDHQFTNLKERLEDQRWREIYLDWVELQFWLDRARGVIHILPFMLAASTYYINANLEAANIGNFFAAKIPGPYDEYWQWTMQCIIDTDKSHMTKENLENLLQTSNDLVKWAEKHLLFPEPIPSFKGELIIILKKVHSKITVATATHINPDLEFSRKQDILESNDASFAHYKQGGENLDNHQFYQAIEEFKHVIEFDPRNVSAHNNRGIAYVHLLKYELAIQDFSRAIELNTDHISSYINRGIAYRMCNAYKMSIEDFSSVIKKYGQNVHNSSTPELKDGVAWAYYSRGITYLYLKDIRRAKDDFIKSRELDSTKLEYGWMAIWCKMITEQFNREIIIDQLQKLANENPNHLISYICRGVISGLYAEVVSGFQDKTPHISYEDALNNLDKAMELDSKIWDIFLWRGMVYAYQEKDAEMEESINKALNNNLPPILLKTFRWMRANTNKNMREFFERHVKPIWDNYGIDDSISQ